MKEGLWNFEAEEGVLGYLFNPLIEIDKKTNVLEVLIPDHFVNAKYKVIFASIKLFRVYDKIVLWDKINALDAVKANAIEAQDLSEIEDFVIEDDVKSYLTIVSDKLQKRRLYDFGEKLKQSMLDGKDQYKLALEAQQVLLHMATRTDLDSNESLLDQVLNEKSEDTLSTGYQVLDEHMGGYSRGMIVTIAGDSGHMKTTFALDSAFRMAERNKDAKIAIFSKEMLAVDLLKKQIARVCKIPINKIFGHDYDKEYVRKKMLGIDAWKNNRIRIINPSTFNGVEDIAKIQMTHKFDIWFLDFIQLLEFSKVANSASDFNVQIGQNMRNLQSLALGTKSVGVILSQVRKGIEYRAIKKPTISDIEWSGLIKQLSSYIFFSYYPVKYYGEEVMPSSSYYLIGEKTRFAENFIFPMKVRGDYGTFEELGSAEREKMKKRLKAVVG